MPVPADLMEEVLSPRARLRIVDAVSVRPRTLRELSHITGISVQGVLRHLKRLAELGAVEERPLPKLAPKARTVYAATSVRVRDFSTPGFTVVRSTVRRPETRGGERVRDLERAAGDLLILRRRIGEATRKLGRLIDEAAEEEERLAAAVRSLPLSQAEKLMVEVALTEDTLEDGLGVLSKYYGIGDRRSIERALAQADRVV
jgi:predicted ArsR family transcriptional regulator